MYMKDRIGCFGQNWKERATVDTIRKQWGFIRHVKRAR